MIWVKCQNSQATKLAVSAHCFPLLSPWNQCPKSVAEILPPSRQCNSLFFLADFCKNLVTNKSKYAEGLSCHFTNLNFHHQF